MLLGGGFLASLVLVLLTRGVALCILVRKFGGKEGVCEGEREREGVQGERELERAREIEKIRGYLVSRKTTIPTVSGRARNEGNALLDAPHGRHG